MTDWETVARKQLALRLTDDLGEVEDATHRLKDALDSGDDLRPEDIEQVRRALTQLQQTVEEDIAPVAGLDAYETAAVGHIPPSAVGGPVVDAALAQFDLTDE